MIDQLREQIKTVALARQQAQKASEAKIAARVEWENQNKALLDEAANTAQIATEQEAKLRELTLQVYAETGSKTPVEGVNVKIFQKLLYNQEEAKDWCLEHRVALKLDAPVFEKLAQAEKLPFITITEEPRAQIATKLEI